MSAKNNNPTAVLVTADMDAIEDIRQAFSLCMPNTMVNTFDKVDELLSSPMPFDSKIIVLDLDVLDGNNLDVIQLLRVRCNTATTINRYSYLITISNDSDQDLVVESLTNGADVHITKPIHELEFIAKVRALLRYAKC